MLALVDTVPTSCVFVCDAFYDTLNALHLQISALIPRLNSVNCWIITEIPVGNSTTTHSTNSSKFPNRRVHFNQRVRQVRDQLTSLKDWWDELNDVYSTVAQAAVMRIEDSIKALSQLKQNGYNVGSLNWKAPKDFRSFTYIQSGFEFDSKNGQPVLSLSKLADIPLIKHRAIPDAETVKEITIKKESTGEWFASFTVGDKETPEKPTDPDRCVGIDVGILKYAHDTDGTAVESLDLSDERERLERAQHDLSQKERGSANWERQRQVVAERHADLKRKRRDFLHKLSNYYATEYDLVAVEGLDAKELVELPETHGIGRERRGERSFECLSTSANAKEHTLPKSIQGTRRKRARLAASRRTSRCGFVNTRVPRVGLRRTGTRTQRGTFFLAVLKI